MKGWAYYNDNDPFVCEWARNLVRSGLVPDGEVDCRSIAEVRPEDLREFGQCHFFAGILGWPYALRLAGWADDRPVWTGSCPCQPLSGAGKRRGHADERHLWPAFFRLIAECKPATVFGEQVASKDGLEWFSGVRADLELSGYACGAANLPAAGVGAPHKRERLFWGAVSNSKSDRRKTEGKWPASRYVDGVCELRFTEASYWKSERPALLLDYGISPRLGVLRAFGNSIVPQVAAEFVRAFMECKP